jgi:hypothetical protein
MNLFDLFNRKDRFKDEISNLQVDILRGKCGDSVLGKPPSRSDFFYESLMKKGAFHSEKWGFGVDLDDLCRDYTFGKIDSFYIEPKFNPGTELFPGTEGFPGTVLANGKPFDMVNANREMVVDVLGDPWWEDNDHDDVLFYYELPEFEIQIELGTNNKLVDILLVKDRYMADEELRESLGVTKPWTF